GVGDALAAERVEVARLGAALDLERVLAVDRGHRHLGPERGLREGDRELEEDVRLLAREELVRADADHAVQVARRRAGLAGLALAGDAQAHALVDAGRDLDLDLALLADRALAAALGARVAHDLAGAAAARAAGLDLEEAGRLHD